MREPLHESDLAEESTWELDEARALRRCIVESLLWVLAAVAALAWVLWR